MASPNVAVASGVEQDAQGTRRRNVLTKEYPVSDLKAVVEVDDKKVTAKQVMNQPSISRTSNTDRLFLELPRILEGLG
jgi:hypothetical protein